MNRVKKVLIVEPDPSLSEILDRLVQVCGEKEYDGKICVFRTRQVADAYQIVSDNNMELIIIDVTGKTTKKEGLDFIASLRGIERYVFLPVIVLSADMQDRYTAFCRLHCFGFLQKPAAFDDAARLIKEALRYRAPETARRYIHFKYGCVVHIMRISEIIRVEHKRREMCVYTADEVLKLPYGTCKETVRQLEGSGFAVYARGKLVNLRYVRSVDVLCQRIVLKADCGELNAGREYIRKIRDTLQEL